MNNRNSCYKMILPGKLYCIVQVGAYRTTKTNQQEKLNGKPSPEPIYTLRGCASKANPARLLAADRGVCWLAFL